MYEPAIQPELERICLRCLSRAMSERYLTASDLADDLKRVIDEHAPPPIVPDAIVPKGLRPFDVEDARFFLALLPGPRRGDGMPESIRFWKDRIESADGGKVFSVGVLYGPTGGGKSSFLRAGLLPNLDRGRTRAVYLEASPAATETRLLEQLHRAIPTLPPDANLPDAVAILRNASERRSSAKLIIVLDQFEQWLQAHPDLPDAELVRALRQCDGGRVQALLVVRDDFWMAATRFLQAVDVPLVQGGNAAAVELFDARHSREVLERFGRALGHLQEAGEPVSQEAGHFLEEAVSGLTDAHGRVIPMQLSLFTEVVKHRPWTTATLRDLGGKDGIGVRFLDDCFTKPEYKPYTVAAKKVLEKLLPPPTSAIRGVPRGAGELRAAAGYAELPREFEDLVRVLAGELRLITVAEPDGPAPGPDPAVPGGETRYQLAHDSLVRPIRRWLEREQGSTPRGRARLRLAVVTASWAPRPGSRRLPSLLEWASILRHIPPREWSTDERRLMLATTRHYATRGVAALAVIAAVALGIMSIRERDRARSVLELAIRAEPGILRGFLPEITAKRAHVRADLERVERDRAAPVRQRVNAVIMLHRERPTAERALALRARLLDAGPDEVGLIRDTLAGDPTTARGDLLLSTLRDNAAADAKRLRAASALAGLAPVAEDVWAAVAADLVRGLLHGEDRRTHPQWLSLLGRARAINDSLRNVCADPAYDPVVRSTAAEALAWSLSSGHDPAALSAALARAQPEASLILLHQLELMNDKQDGLSYLESLEKDPGEPRGDLANDCQAMAAVALAVLGQPETLRHALQHDADPGLRTAIIQKIATLKLAPRVLHDQLPWADLDSTQRQAVLLAWAETIPLQEIPPAVSAAVLGNARRSFKDDLDPGVHSAAELLIRRWDRAALPVLEPSKRKPPGRYVGNRRWEIGPNGHTLVYLRGPLVFRMGSPEAEDKRLPHESQHDCRIERSLLVATTETTVKQYQRFKRDHLPDPRFCEKGRDSSDNPVGGVSWYEAIRYCNWLSREAGLEPFFPNEVKPGTLLPNGGRDRGGFRLPTEAEWEYFCRCATETCRAFGNSDQFLDRYVWTVRNSRELLWPTGRLLPNEFGLFDTLGSQWEWCLDGPVGADSPLANPGGSTESPALDAFSAVPVNEHDWRYVRGGSFSRTPPFARSAHRDIFDAPSESAMFGFRVVRTVTPEDEANE
jgi:formylglycine-generating enzyme required for sulfatase activity